MLMKILLWFLRRSNPTATVETIDPWDGSGGFYVSELRYRLDKIARLLSHEGRLVCTRFVPDLKCAELYVLGEGVVARVAAHGETCAIYRVIVTRHSLPESEEDLFSKNLPYVEFAVAA